MGFYRIMDLRVRIRECGDVDVYMDGLGNGDSAKLRPGRLGAMLQVFNNGRHCYWDPRRNVFTTDLTLPASPESGGTITEGEVASWEVRIPSEGDALVVLNLLGEYGRPVSGDRSVGRRVLRLEFDDELNVVLSLLASQFVRLEGDALRNSEFADWF